MEIQIYQYSFDIEKREKMNETLGENTNNLTSKASEASDEDLLNIDDKCLVPRCSIFVICLILIFLISAFLIVFWCIRRKYYSKRQNIYLKVRAISVTNHSDFHKKTPEKYQDVVEKSSAGNSLTKGNHASSNDSKETAVEVKLRTSLQGEKRFSSAVPNKSKEENQMYSFRFPDQNPSGEGVKQYINTLFTQYFTFFKALFLPSTI